MMAYYLKIIKIFIISITLITFSQTALADRKARSEKNKIKAEQWCMQYTTEHVGETCQVIKIPKFCPKHFRRGARFKKIRSRGYKTCVPGSKGKVIGQAIKNTHKVGIKGVKKSVQGTKKITKASARGTKKTTIGGAKLIKGSTVFGTTGAPKEIVKEIKK